MSSWFNNFILGFLSYILSHIYFTSSMECVNIRFKLQSLIIELLLLTISVCCVIKVLTLILDRKNLSSSLLIKS